MTALLTHEDIVGGTLILVRRLAFPEGPLDGGDRQGALHRLRFGGTRKTRLAVLVRLDRQRGGGRRLGRAGGGHQRPRLRGGFSGLGGYGLGLGGRGGALGRPDPVAGGHPQLVQPSRADQVPACVDLLTGRHLVLVGAHVVAAVLVGRVSAVLAAHRERWPGAAEARAVGRFARFGCCGRGPLGEAKVAHRSHLQSAVQGPVRRR